MIAAKSLLRGIPGARSLYHRALQVFDIEKPAIQNEKGQYLIGKTWLYLDDRDSLGLARHGYYEREEIRLIERLVKPSFTVLDIGANIGYHTLMMAGLARQVYAFEPEPKNFAILQKNILSNRCLVGNISAYPYAVSSNNESTDLHLCQSNRGMHRIYASRHCDGGKVVIQTVRLDSLLGEDEKIDFIKMDIEGAEYGALLGMERIIERCKPIILMEFNPESIREYGADPWHVFRFMLSTGYTVRRAKKPDNVLWDFKRLEKDAFACNGFNLICIPNPKTP